MNNSITSTSIIVTLISIIATLGGAPLSNYIWNIIGDLPFISYTSTYIITVIGLLLVLVIPVTIVMIKWDKFSRYLRVISLPLLSRLFLITKPKQTYKLLFAEFLYVYTADWEMKNCIKLDFKVLSNVFLGIKIAQRWSGKSKLKNDVRYTVSNPEYIVIKNNNVSENKAGFTHYIVSLKNKKAKLMKGNTVENLRIYSSPMIDSAKKSEPYYSKTIDVPIKKLTLSVSFNKDNSRKVVGMHGQIFTHSVDNTPYVTVNDIKMSEDICNVGYITYSWEIKNPIYGGRYVLLWDFVV